MNLDELEVYVVSLEELEEDDEYGDGLTKDTLIKLVEIEILFKDVATMIRAR